MPAKMKGHKKSPIPPPPLKGDSTPARAQRTEDRFQDRQKRDIKSARRQVLFAQMEKVGRDFIAGGRQGMTVELPCGRVQLSKFATQDPAPKITTRKKDFGGAPVGHKYQHFVMDVFSPSDSKVSRKRNAEVAAELLETIETGVLPPAKRRRIESGQPSNAAAKLLAVSQISEPLRVGGSSKLLRGTLRMIQAGAATPEEVFLGDNPLFSMAKNPATQRRLTNRKQAKLRKPPIKPKHFDKLADYISDSSDDESGSNTD